MITWQRCFSRFRDNLFFLLDGIGRRNDLLRLLKLDGVFSGKTEGESHDILEFLEIRFS